LCKPGWSSKHQQQIATQFQQWVEPVLKKINQKVINSVLKKHFNQADGILFPPCTNANRCTQAWSRFAKKA
jgi:hypothetical protein